MASSVDVKAVLSTLTLEEKVSLLAGANMWESVPIPAKGIPAMKCSDGPNGARGASFTDGTTAACFPAACCVASTFDVNLAERIGSALAEETLSKGARCLLAPTMCTHRHPLGGRNFESFSEDPYLTGKMAARVVQGCQSRGVSATIKHFAGNEQETQRLSVNEAISERALREIYLRPFEIAIKEANPWAVMTAYNMVNGHHADSSPFLLQKVLRGEWGWDGLVMSDWGGTNSLAESLNAGLDLEMPGPTRWRKADDVIAAVNAGKVTQQTIDERAFRVLGFLKRLKYFEDPVIPTEQAINKPEHQALIREVGSKGIVLLKNQNNVLPLSKNKIKGSKIAMLGYAKTGLAHGGGSASVHSHYKITPWDAMRKALGDSVEFSYAQGAHTFRKLSPISDNVTGLDGKPGFTYKLFDLGSEEPSEVRHGHENSHVSVLDSFHFKNKEVRLEGVYTAPQTAKHYFTCLGVGPSKLLINDEVIYDQTKNCGDVMGFLFGGVPTPEVQLQLQAGKQYKIEVRTKPPGADEGEDLGIFEGHTGVLVGCMDESEHDKDLLSEAVEAAKKADVAVVFVGHETEWETEGQDQASFNLPRDGSQDRLIAAVAAVNSKTIVVNSTGVAVAMPWLNDIQGLIHTWYPGQECGNAIADVLTGAQNPEGHLPCTFPKTLEDCPAYGNFPGEYVNGKLKVAYKEDVFVGYRHFDRLPANKINFPFGFGLSYTTFTYSDLTVAESGNDFTVTAKVTNTGSLAGGIAAQLYVGNVATEEENPIKTLAAFKKVVVGPGETTTVSLPVRSRDFAFFDVPAQKWIVKSGDYSFGLGKSAGEIVLEMKVAVQEKTFAP